MLRDYDKELRSRTGCTLLEVAEDAACAPRTIKRILEQSKAAVVPMSSGRGVIEGFSNAVAATLMHIGLPTIVTGGTDAVGISEAYDQRVDLLFIADDATFVAINTHKLRVVNNATSTAKAYVAGLNGMANGLAAQPVLVVGAGTVGSAAVSNLIEREAQPLVVDIVPNKLNKLKVMFGQRVAVFRTLEDALCKTNLIINTAPVDNLITTKMVDEKTMIAAPAMPPGLTLAAARKVKKHLLHDPLQLGVATMAVEALAE
jgi:pyrrolysine biosynthesis protein PylD